MASITIPATAIQTGALRPLNILHDLPEVADLIELCFESTMDDEGQSYLREMRRASRDKDFLSWAGRVMESTSMPLAGYVWEEGGKIIGNASLVFQNHRGRKIAMIANVATHPNYRRRGIGRGLTERAMTGARQRGAKELWLQVRHDNLTAIKIYEDLGFVERARRTTYRTGGGKAPSQPASLSDPAADASGGTTPRIAPAGPVTIARPSPRHWETQHEWLRRAHPDELAWYARWDWEKLGPGLKNTVYRLFVQLDSHQWAATRRGHLLATVSWIPSLRVSNALWVAAPRDGDAASLGLALERARHDLAHYRKLTIEYPAEEMRGAIESAGFEAFRTLLWMRAPATAQEVARIQPKKET